MKKLKNILKEYQKLSLLQVNITNDTPNKYN